MTATKYHSKKYDYLLINRENNYIKNSIKFENATDFCMTLPAVDDERCKKLIKILKKIIIISYYSNVNFICCVKFSFAKIKSE